MLLSSTSALTLGQEKSINEELAKNYIIKNADQLGYVKDALLEMYFVREGSTGETVRFNQYIGGVPIYKGDIAVHFNKNRTITYAAETIYTKGFKSVNTTPNITEEQAIAIANAQTPPIGEITYKHAKLYLYNKGEGDTHLAYQVVVTSFDRVGEWESMVDAHTGEVLNVEDISSYAYHKNGPRKPKAQKNKQAIPPKTVAYGTGTAYVFDPDPLSKMGVSYGGDYVDGNDATNASLDAARTFVVLPEVEENGGIYTLRSTYATIGDFESPSTGLFTQSSPDFLFNRNDQGFEAVNAFYHIHNSMKYINETLGIVCKPTLNSNRVIFDPHGLSGQDNSHYVLNTQRLAFGEGCVDDAEDADVIIHELGHGIHHWITGLSSSSAQGLGEGSGDYWAMSYSRSLNQWAPSDPQYHWVFNWDGHNTCWNGRITNYTATYPTSTINNSSYIHSNGQIWASCLMRIYDQIGREKTDRIFLEGLAMTNSSANQQSAAVAVRQAAIDMLGTHGFTCNDIDIITTEMTNTGYTLPAYNCILATGETVKVSDYSIYPNPASDYLIVNAKSHSADAAIYNAEGRLVQKLKLHKGENKIDLNQLVKGNYVLSIGSDVSHKFIKK